MPVVDEAPSRLTRGARVVLSAPSELYAATNLIGFYVLHDRIKAPWVEDLVKQRPDLVDRLTRIYFPAGAEIMTSTGCTCWETTEILIYAHRSGTLLDLDLDRFFARVNDAAQEETPPDFAMPTESPEVEEMMRQRLERYRTGPERRAEAFAAFREVWEFVRPGWDGEGRAAAIIEADRLREGLQRGKPLAELLPPDHLALFDQFGPMIAEAVASRSLLITPLALGGQLTHIIAFPGLTVIGYGPGAGGGNKFAGMREEMEEVAGRFKLVADPTRALILRMLLRLDLSVSDLASMLELSQPTVSAHVKQLREAGLLDSRRVGTATLYRASRQRVEATLGDALSRLMSTAPGRS